MLFDMSLCIACIFSINCIILSRLTKFYDYFGRELIFSFHCWNIVLILYSCMVMSEAKMTTFCVEGMPTETTIAIVSMLFGGVFEKFPRLKVCFAHGGIVLAKL